jgi:hypothetical protein
MNAPNLVRCAEAVTMSGPIVWTYRFTGLNRTYVDKAAFSICFSLSVSNSCSRRF